MSKEVWFIRHGESVSNANLPTTHPAASELTAKGHREAEYVAQAFTRKPDLIVVSPYIRARQTAVPTINRFNPIPVAEWPIHEFSYLHPDRYDGTTGEQRWPAARDYWHRMDPLEKEDGEGESFIEMMTRVREMDEQISNASESFIAMFSHGLFLRAYLWMHLSGFREANSHTMERYLNFSRGLAMPNASILKTRFEADGRILLSPFDTNHIPEKLGLVDE
ncbi:histidine phosphatase family protein [Candidatus Leptofilum sp.]|uniref:histidine phosphatase family protein n=1 Tax=Candidatus Leptofilum sp. TaxID=3241576 RepID=UPI003B58D94D